MEKEWTEERTVAAMEENVRLGYMERTSDGRYRLTQKGQERINQMKQQNPLIYIDAGHDDGNH